MHLLWFFNAQEPAWDEITGANVTVDERPFKATVDARPFAVIVNERVNVTAETMSQIFMAHVDEASFSAKITQVLSLSAVVNDTVDDISATITEVRYTAIVNERPGS